MKRKMITLEEAVRKQIGAGGPQLPSAEYHTRIEVMLDEMTPRELLVYISTVMGEIIVD